MLKLFFLKYTVKNFFGEVNTSEKTQCNLLEKVSIGRNFKNEVNSISVLNSSE